ncbi:phospho-acceptor domain-containing protein [Sphingomonas sp. F9_3S_D5_B_2]
MRFDDRLLTVLNQPAGNRHDVAVRWRQLVDLVARQGTNLASPAVMRALATIRSEAAQVDEPLRAAAARSIAALPLPLGLLECFAADKLSVSAPILAAANLQPSQWTALLESADPETRRFVATLQSEVEAAPTNEIADTAEAAAPEPEIQAQAGPEPDLETEAEPELKTEPEPDLETEAEPKIETEAEPEPAATVEAEASDRPVATEADEQSSEGVNVLTLLETEITRYGEVLAETAVGLEVAEAEVAETALEAAEDVIEPEPEPEPEPEQVAEVHPRPEPESMVGAAPAPASPAPSLSELIARIEDLRRRRAPLEENAPPAVAQPAVFGAPGLFRWECQPSGLIAWVDGVPRGALIGRSIARSDDESGGRVDAEMARAFSMRAPFRDASLVIAGEGLASGEWKVSGVPAFDPADGRFAGYRGIAIRDVPPQSAEPDAAGDVLADRESLRELVHEIKTPLNAIIGFAEIIEGQYLGPADRRYRERAGDIVGQARLLLGAIDDLDFAAQLHSSSAAADPRSHLAEQVESLSVSLRELAAARDVELDVSSGAEVGACRVEPELLDRLLYRLCATIIEHARAEERLQLTVSEAYGTCRFSISRPHSLRGATDQQLFDATSAGEGTELRVGFTLRLVRGLARIAGGDLATTRAGITLILPSA